MLAVFAPYFIDIILYIINLLYIPQKNYYKFNHFQNYLLNYEIGDEEKNKYINIINELESKLENSLKINQTLLAFSIFLLIFSVFLIILIIIIIIFVSREQDKIDKDNISTFMNVNVIKLIFTFINWSMALAIIAKINKIRKNEDKIGLTNEIRNNIIKVIIILTVCFVFHIVEFVYFYNIDSNSILTFNSSYVNKLNNTIQNLEKNNDNLKENNKI